MYRYLDLRSIFCIAALSITMYRVFFSFLPARVIKAAFLLALESICWHYYYHWSIRPFSSLNTCTHSCHTWQVCVSTLTLTLTLWLSQPKCCDSTNQDSEQQITHTAQEEAVPRYFCHWPLLTFHLIFTTALQSDLPATICRVLAG